MDARSDFFVYMGAAIGTVVVLFGAQLWYESYLDVAVVHGQALDAPMDAKLAAVRSAEAAKLSGGSMPIAKAMEAFATRGHAASPRLAPQPSQDLSAMSGWAHRKGFKPYEPRVPPAPPAPPAGALDPAAAGTGAAVVEAGAAAPAPAQPTVTAQAAPTKILVGGSKPVQPAQPSTP